MIRASKRTPSIRRGAVRKVRRAFRPHPLGPADEGVVLTESQYLRCSDAPGYVSEIFDGAVHVSPSAKPNHDIWQNLIQFHLQAFARRHPDRLNYVTCDNDVVIPIRPGPTRPRPDITAYRGFSPSKVLRDSPDWAEFCPIIVAEIVSPRRRRKDTERNRGLYWTAGGISEYWIVDPRGDASKPLLIAHWRESGRPDWLEEKVEFGNTYQCRSIPELSINLKQILEQA